MHFVNVNFNCVLEKFLHCGLLCHFVLQVRKARKSEKIVNAKKLEARKKRLAAKEAKESKANKKKLLKLMEKKVKKQSVSGALFSFIFFQRHFIFTIVN